MWGRNCVRSFPDPALGVHIVARTWRDYIRRVLTTGFIGLHTVTHNYTVYTLTAPYSSLQHLPSLHTVSSLVACLPVSQDPFACNFSLKTAAQPEYSLVTANLTLCRLSTGQLSYHSMTELNYYSNTNSLTAAAPLSNTNSARTPRLN
jgi:hypothetical protein